MAYESHIRTLSNYSDELGLQTHRPRTAHRHDHSVLNSTTDRPYRSVPDRVQYGANQPHSANLSYIDKDFSIIPQSSHAPQILFRSVKAERRDCDDWWSVPTNSSRNYEQRLTSVSVAFSAHEIYNQAKVDPVIHASKNSDSKPQSDSPDYEVNDRKPASKIATGITNTTIDLKQYKLSSTGKEYIHSQFRHRPAPVKESPRQPETPIETSGESPTHRLPTAWPETNRYSEYKPPTALNERSTDFTYTAPYDIKYRTFAEARQMYPSSESDKSGSIDLTSHPSPESKHQTVNQSAAREGNDKKEEDPAKLTIESLCEKGSHPIAIDQWITGQNKLIESRAYEVSQVPEKPAEVINKKEGAPSKQSEFTTQAPRSPPTTVQSDEKKGGGINSPVISEQSLDGLKKRAAQLLPPQVTESQEWTVRKKSAKHKLSRSTPGPTVPPIDLSHLSPRKTKTRLSKKGEVRSSVAVKSKNVGLEFSNTKKQQSRSLDTTKTKQIAEEIKMRVNQKSNKADMVSIIPEQLSKEKLWSNPALLSARSSALSSYRGYDKYNIMSPRIQSGELSIWQCLPEELWLIILSSLTVNDLYSFMMTCRDFQRISLDKSLWKTVTITKKQLADAELEKLGQLQPTRLLIVQCSGTKLNGDIVTNRGMTSLFSAIGNNLKQLSVASCVQPPLSGEAMMHHAALHCTNITDLNVSWCNLSDRDVTIIGDSFQHLHSLRLNGNQSLTDESVEVLYTRFQNQLKILEIFGCFKISTNGLFMIGQCERLGTLNIGQCYRLPAVAIQQEVSRLPALTHLNMKGLKQLKDSCVTAIMKHCPRITSLNLSQCSGLTAKSLLEVSCALSDLDILDISSCPSAVTDASVCALLANCRRLLSLDLSSTSVTNRTLNGIATTCTRLQELKLNFCSVSEVGVRALVERVITLTNLQLYGVKGINNETISTRTELSVEN